MTVDMVVIGYLQYLIRILPSVILKPTSKTYGQAEQQDGEVKHAFGATTALRT